MPRKAAAKFQMPAAARKNMAQFVRKLVELLETAPASVVSWTRNGTAFRVHNQKAFSAVLGRHFRSCQLNNFVRQLNFYAFQKLNGGAPGGSLEFTHPLFRRGDWASIQQIKRKTSSEFHVTYEHELKALRETTDSLRSAVSSLKSQLAVALAQVSTLTQERDQSVAHAAAVTDVAASSGVLLPAELVEAATRRLARVQTGVMCTSVPRGLKTKTRPTMLENRATGAGERVGASVHRRSRKRQRTAAPPAVPGGGDVSPQKVLSSVNESAPTVASSLSSDLFALFEGDPVGDAVNSAPDLASVGYGVDADVFMGIANNIARNDSAFAADDTLESAFTDLSWLDSPVDTLAPPRLFRGLSCESVAAVGTPNDPLMAVTAPALSARLTLAA